MKVDGSSGARILVSCLVLGVLAAGCTGASKPRATDGISGSVGPADFDEKTCGITGRILDEERLPVAGAQVGIIALNISRRSALDGRYALDLVAAGNRTVAVQAVNFMPVSKTVACVAGQEIKDVDFRLTPVPTPAAPFEHLPSPQKGSIGCSARVFWVSGGVDTCKQPLNVTPAARATVPFTNLPYGNVTAYVMEIRWEYGTPVRTDALRFSSLRPGKNCEPGNLTVSAVGKAELGQENIVVKGASPLRLQVSTNSTDCPLFAIRQPQERTHTVTAGPDGPAGLGGFTAQPTAHKPVEAAVYVDFEVFYTLFYHGQPVPPDFTAIKDGK